MKKLLLCLCTALLISCSSIPGIKPSTQFAVAGLSADVYSTYSALDRGCTEKNPVYAGMNVDQIALTNAAIGLGLWYFEDDLPDWLLWTTGAVRFTVAGYNSTLDCK